MILKIECIFSMILKIECILLCRCTRSAVTDTQYTAHNLLPNREYEFRVAALNEAGLSDWSEASDLIEAKNPEGIANLLACLICLILIIHNGSSFNIKTFLLLVDTNS